MSIQAIIKQLYGSFEPTGLYSFEFVSSGDSITELFFMLPPGSVRVTEGQRSGIQPTLSGSYITDFGNSPKEIAISGSIWFLYTGDIISQQQDAAQKVVDGYSEYEKLRFAIIRHRDYMMSDNGNSTAPSFSGMTGAQALKTWARKQVSFGSGTFIDQLEIIFHDYDLNNHYYVKIDSFSSENSKDDIYSVNYDITMQGYQVASGPQKKEKILQKQTPVETIDAALQEIDALSISAIIEEAYPHMHTETGIFQASQEVQTSVTAMQTARTNIQAGYSVRKAFAGNEHRTVQERAENLIHTIERAFIPFDQQEAFSRGDVTLDMFVTQPLLKLYNTMQKLIMCNQALIVSVREASLLPLVPIHTTHNAYVIDSEMFEETISEQEQKEHFELYTVMQGDTLKKISQKMYGTHAHWYLIGTINKLTDNDLLDTDLVGTRIKIPQNITIAGRERRNLVYEYALNPDHTDQYTHGADIATRDKCMIIDSSGDRKLTKGALCTIHNVTTRLESAKGSLNPLHPEWGIVSLADSSRPFVVQLDRVLSDMENQVISDPRVQDAGVIYDTLEIRENTVRARMHVELVGGYTHQVEVSL